MHECSSCESCGELAIIPARAGSKRLLNKNIAPLSGKPLIAWTIEAAKQCKMLDGNVVVSTNGHDIAEVARSYGAEVIMRPDELATDTSPTIDAIFHALTIRHADVVVLLQPSSPLRDSEDIAAAIELFLQNDQRTVISFCAAIPSPYWCFSYKNGKFKPLFGKKYLGMRSQDAPSVYRPNGAIYISTVKNLKRYKSFYQPKIVPYIMPDDRSIDIDVPLDILVAELKIKISRLT